MRLEKELSFVLAAYKDLRSMPAEVQDDIGYSLDLAQHGRMAGNVKPMKGFSGVEVMEITARHRTDTYRGIYTAKFDDVIYVLHCFQKKSKTGIETPQQEIDLIKKRLREAERLHTERAR